MTSEFPTKFARIASVLAVIGSVIWVQWPLDLSKFGVGPLVLFLASVVAWISIELADLSNDLVERNGHEIDDINKINILLNFINKKQYYILRHHNVETYIASDAYRSLEDLIAYKDIDITDFHNEKIRSSYSRLLTCTSEFLNDLWGLYTSDGKGRATWRSRNDGWVSPEIYNEIQDKIAGLNAKSSKIASIWEELVTTARKDFKVSSPRISQYDLN